MKITIIGAGPAGLYFARLRKLHHPGDEITIHVTNVEQTTDMIHGLGIIEHDMNVVVDPGETKTVKFTATRAGVFPFYCTNFCSALHQEMQGYLAVKP